MPATCQDKLSTFDPEMSELLAEEKDRQVRGGKFKRPQDSDAPPRQCYTAIHHHEEARMHPADNIRMVAFATSETHARKGHEYFVRVQHVLE